MEVLVGILILFKYLFLSMSACGCMCMSEIFQKSEDMNPELELD